MASRNGINIYIPNYFMVVKNCIKYSCSLWVKGTSLLTCSYIGEPRNGRKFKCENKPFIVLILVLRKDLSYLKKKNQIELPCRMFDEFLKNNIKYKSARPFNF